MDTGRPRCLDIIQDEQRSRRQLRGMSGNSPPLQSFLPREDRRASGEVCQNHPLPCVAVAPAPPCVVAWSGVTSFSHPHPSAAMPAAVLHDFGHGPAPLFGWESVTPLTHGYGSPAYARRFKPDYRRYCYSVGKADVPFAALPGGPLWGYPTTMSPQLVGRWSIAHFR